MRRALAVQAQAWLSILCALLTAGIAQAQSKANDNTSALLAQGHSDEAMRALETQVGTNPFDPVSMNNLAAVKAAHQDWNAAAALLVRAHRLAPNNAIVSANLDRLNGWLARGGTKSPAQKPATDDRLAELAQIPPEPPELWSVPGTSAGAKTK